jgi:rare lipoprotein A
MRSPIALLLLCVVAVPVQAQAPKDVLQAIRASWYDCKQPGECSRSKRTANGETFNPDAMTCAHRTAKFGTRFRIHYRGRTAICRTNDRGPFVPGRELDMARAVARALGIMGVAVVKIERL